MKLLVDLVEGEEIIGSARQFGQDVLDERTAPCCVIDLS